MEKQASRGICINGIGKFHFTFWKESIIELSEHPEYRLFYYKAGATSEDNEFVAEFLDQYEIQDLQNSSLGSSELESILFTDTADNLSFVDELEFTGSKACFFGGLGRSNHQEQADCAERLKIDRLITDVLPDELANMSGSCPEFLLDRFKFLPPSTSSIETMIGVHDEQVLCFLIEEEAQIKDLTQKRIFNALSSSEYFRCENLSFSKTSDFSTELLLPGKNCHTILLIGENPLLHHVLSQICDHRGLRFIIMGSKASLSPVRSILLNDENLIGWIDSIEPVKSLSLRQSILEIIQGNPSSEKQDGTFANDRENSQKDLKLEELLTNEGTGKSAEISKFYKSYFLASGNEVKTFVSHPVHYLENSLEVPKTISFSLSLLFTEGMPEITPPKVLKSLIYGAMRFACKLPYNFGKIHFLSQTMSINHEHFISNLGNFSDRNNASAELTSFYAATHYAILTSWLDEELRNKLIIALLEIQKDIVFSARLFLSLNDAESFHKLLSHAQPGSLRDLASSAVGFCLRNQSLENNENLSQYEKYCSDAIESGHDGTGTHLTLALLKILKRKGQGIAKRLVSPDKPQLGFDTRPFLWHELALFSIFAGDDEEANALLDSPKNKNGAPEFTNRLGAIAISLLLGKMEQADRFASELDLEGTLETWSPKSPPYFIAFYHTIIFKYCSDQTSIKNAHKMMDLSKIELDKAFRPLIDRISSINNPREHLQKLSNALARSMPEIS